MRRARGACSNRGLGLGLNLSPGWPRPRWKRGRNADGAGLALGSGQQPVDEAAAAVLLTGRFLTVRGHGLAALLVLLSLRSRTTCAIVI